MLCFNWKAGIFPLPYCHLGVQLLLLQDICQEVCRISASLEIHCPSHKGTLLGKERFLLPASVVLKDSSLLGCVEWQCLSPSLSVWDRMRMQRAVGCDGFVGRSLEPGSILRDFFFISANIISNGFLLSWSMKGQRISWKFTYKHLEPNECQISCRTIPPFFFFI